MEKVRKTRKLPEQIADRLREMIIQESMKTGAKLPAEAELMERFGVSRSTVREAVKILLPSQRCSIRLAAGEPQPLQFYLDQAVRLLERTNTRKINGDFIGILGPDTKYMLMNDPMWIDVAKYQDAAKLYNNEVGKLYGVRFVETSEASILEGAGASSADVAQTFIFGDQAYATTQLSGGGQPRIIVKPLGSAGAEDPLDQFGTVGYKVEGYGAAILNQTHLVCIESALLD